MRMLTGILVTLGSATALFSQNHGGQPVLVGTVGSVVHPGGSAGTGGSVVHPGGSTGSGGIVYTGGSVVHPGGGGVHLVVPNRSNRNTSNNSRFRGVYAYPVYIGGLYDTPYISQQEPVYVTSDQPSNTGYASAQQQYQPAALPQSETIYPSAPAASRRTQLAQAEDDSDSPHYLIAFKDHTVYTALSYWVDGDTLHYYTSANVHNQVSLSLVDRAFTERLNKGAGNDLKLPEPAAK